MVIKLATGKISGYFFTIYYYKILQVACWNLKVDNFFVNNVSARVILAQNAKTNFPNVTVKS